LCISIDIFCWIIISITNLFGKYDTHTYGKLLLLTYQSRSVKS
jgi:hypothetical protein